MSRRWLEEALRSAEQRGHALSKESALCLLKECIKQRDLRIGKRIQLLLRYDNLESIAILANHLIRFFASLGCLYEANQVFTKVSKPDRYTWNAIIDAHVRLGQTVDALYLYWEMQHSGAEPDKFTFPGILKLCGNLGFVEQGRRIHEQIVENGLQLHLVVGSSLVDMYAKSGLLNEGRKVFDQLTDRDVVSWSGMIAGYAQHGQGIDALECFESMKNERIRPDKFIFSSIIKACGIISDIYLGRCMHEHSIECGFQSDIVVGNTLVHLYAKFGSLHEAHGVFEKMLHPSVVSWTAMIAGYTDHAEGCLALECFEDMQAEDIKPDRVIFLSILRACGSVGAIEQGRYIHEAVIESALEYDAAVGSSLVDMYFKCGNVDEALKVSQVLPNDNVVLWGAIVAGYAQLGETNQAVQCFENMPAFGVKPDDIAFSNILIAFNRAGLVDEGLWYFKTIAECHGITCGICHITCIIDLLGHAGCFYEAHDLVIAVSSVDICLWMTLLNACRTHKNVELGRQCFDRIIHLDVFCDAAYVLLSHIYASVNMIDNACEIKMLRQKSGLSIEFAKTLMDNDYDNDHSEICAVLAN